MDVKTYAVTVTFKFPIPGERDGAPIEVLARNANEAIKKARQEMSSRGYTRHDGPITYTAKVKKD